MCCGLSSEFSRDLSQAHTREAGNLRYVAPPRQDFVLFNEFSVILGSCLLVMADGNATSTFDVKLKELQMTCKGTDSVLDSNKDTAIKRQLAALKALTSEAEMSRRGRSRYVELSSRDGDRKSRR